MPKVITRKDDYTSVEAYEEKLFSVKIPKLLKNPTWQSKKTGQPRNAILESVAKNEKWHKDRTENGITKHFTCKRCTELKPYTSFLFAKTKRGRKLICKKCRSIENKAKYDPKYQQNRWRKNYIQKIRTIIGVQIRRDMSTYRDEYAKDLSIPDIWNFIEKNLGYDAQELCEHLESQFDDKMNWNNHGRGNHQYHWQIDHIKARSLFPYTSLNDENFLKCWTLSNLRPLEQQQNQQRYYNW